MITADTAKSVKILESFFDTEDTDNSYGQFYVLCVVPKDSPASSVSITIIRFYHLADPLLSVARIKYPQADIVQEKSLELKIIVAPGYGSCQGGYLYI